MRATYEIHHLDRVRHKVFIVDLANTTAGTTITNDAEAVCRHVHNRYPGQRIIYRDTADQWDEMIHEKGRFLGFATYDGPVPPAEAEGPST